MDPTDAGCLAQVQGKVVIRRQVVPQPSAGYLEIDRVSPRDDFWPGRQLPRQLDKRQPTGVFRPLVVRLEGS